MLASQDESNVVNEPFPVHSHEFVTEWVRLLVAHELFDVVRMVKAVNGAYIHPLVLIDYYLPELDVARQDTQEHFGGGHKSTNGSDIGQQDWIRKWIIQVPDHRCQSQVEEEDPPGSQADNVIVLRGEVHVVDGSPGMGDRAVKR